MSRKPSSSSIARLESGQLANTRNDFTLNTYSSNNGPALRTPTNGAMNGTSGYLDSIKAKAEALCKKVSVMNSELNKIYLSLQNCHTLISDWRHQAKPEESDKLRQLATRAQQAVDSNDLQYEGQVNKIKEEVNSSTMSWVTHIQGLISRLDSMSSDCKTEITSKASELLSLKNEMDQFDPAKRIPISLKSYTR